MRKKGFTLIELLAVLVMIGLLLGIMMPAIQGLLRKGRETRAATDKATIRAALVNYLGEYGSWPCVPAAGNGQGYIIDNDTEDPWTNAFLFADHDELIEDYLDRDGQYNPKKVHFGNWTEYDWNDAKTHMISPASGNRYQIIIDFERMDAQVSESIVAN